MRRAKVILLSFILLIPTFLFPANKADGEAKYGLVIPREIKEFWEGNTPRLQSLPPVTESAVDWSSQDSPVKNQRYCGSCWAFAAVACIENIGAQTDLSEQVVVSCTSGSCGGGWYGNALRYFHDDGVPPESCYPYTSTNGSCDNACAEPPFLEKVNTYDYYGRWGVPTAATVNNLKSLLQSGPVIVSMLVPDDGTFDGYSGGIYDYAGGEISEENGHAILVVGYNDNGSYFKVKNSWGTNWGENGYFRIAYDDVTDDTQFGGYACKASGAYTEYASAVETVSKPGTPSGQTSPQLNTSYTYTTSGATSSEGHTVEYRFSWGDGTYSAWSTFTSASHAWSTSGSKIIKVTARCQTHTDITNISDGLTVSVPEPPETVSKPGTPQGTAAPVRYASTTYSTSGATSNLGHPIEYRFNWGDGSTSAWSTSKSASHAYTTLGAKTIQVTARCQTHTDKTNISDGLTVTVKEPEEVVSQPGQPTGETTVTQSIPTAYTTSGASSNLGHPIEYQFNWGDGSFSSWSTSKTQSHAWETVGSKTVRVTARCQTHTEKSAISSGLTVTVEPPEEISTPGTPEGESHPTVDSSYVFTADPSVSNLGHPVEYQFNWGDGETSAWSAISEATYTWTIAGEYTVSVTARCTLHPEKFAQSAGTIVHAEPPETISTPEPLTGPLTPTVDLTYDYSIIPAVSNLGHDLEYQIDWGDSTFSDWSSVPEQSHAWSSVGGKSVIISARCQEHPQKMNFSEPLTIQVLPHEVLTTPGTPEGEMVPTRDFVYTYATTGSISNLGHPLQYQFHWSDGESSEWSPSLEADHAWSVLGDQTVIVSVRCQQHPDTMNVSDTLWVQVIPPPVAVQFASTPDSLEITVDDTLRVTPFFVHRMPGDTLTFFADSLQGYYDFDSWAHGGPLRQEFILTEADSLFSIRYQLRTYNVTLSVNDTTWGDITADPGSSAQPALSWVRLTAAPAPGYYFSHWTGDLEGSNNPDSVFIDSVKTVTAHFLPQDFDPPELVSAYPPANAWVTPINERVSIHLRDKVYALEPDSLRLSINGSMVILRGKDLTGRASLASDSLGLKILYTPQIPFSQNQPVMVDLRCYDSALVPNKLDTSYTFVTGESSTSLIAQFPFTPGEDVYGDSTSLLISQLSDSSVTDVLNVTVSEVIHPPALPDTLEFLGTPLHAGPHGFVPGHPIDAQFKLPSGDLSTGKITLLHCPASTGQWRSVSYEIQSNYLHFLIDELGYFALARFVPETVQLVSRPSGQTEVTCDSVAAFSITKVSGNRGGHVVYQFDWGNGETSGWQSDTSAAYTWSDPGRYPVLVIAALENNPSAQSVSDTLWIDVLPSNTTGVENLSAIPDRFDLLQNTPNPFNPLTRITYHMPKQAQVVITLFNIRGQRINTLVNEVKSAGVHEVIWHGDDYAGQKVSSGIYLYVMESDHFVKRMKLLLLK